MARPSPINEKSMQRMEAFIPTLAHIAVQRARWQALATCDKVVEARDGQLIETAANGTVRVIRTIAKPMAVAMGTKRIRAYRAPL